MVTYIFRLQALLLTLTLSGSVFASTEPIRCRFAGTRPAVEVLKSQAILTADQNSFRVLDTGHNVFRFEASLYDGTLKVSAFLIDPVRGVRSSLDGKVLYRDMMEHFGPENIQVIKGRWFSGTNYDRFLSGMEQGLSPQDAAMKTWSGRMAIKYGFSRVENIQLQTLDLESGLTTEAKSQPIVDLETAMGESGSYIELDFVRP